MLFSGFDLNSVAECLFTQYTWELFFTLCVKWHLLTIPISYAQRDTKFLVNIF